MAGKWTMMLDKANPTWFPSLSRLGGFSTTTDCIGALDGPALAAPALLKEFSSTLHMTSTLVCPDHHNGHGRLANAAHTQLWHAHLCGCCVWAVDDGVTAVT